MTVLFDERHPELEAKLKIDVRGGAAGGSGSAGSVGDGGSSGGEPCEPDRARVVLLPVPYEKTTTYRKGTARGPLALLRASMSQMTMVGQNARR